MPDGSEQVVATLVSPDEYKHHLNQVAGLTTESIVFLKRKFLSTSGYELVRHPIGTCARVKYVDERPALTVVSGALLVGLVAAILYMLVTTWDRLDPGTRVPIGLLGLAGLYGIRRVFGARRHRLVFTLKDGTRLSWTSRPGYYELKKASTGSVVEVARSREILDDSRLRRI